MKNFPEYLPILAIYLAPKEHQPLLLSAYAMYWITLITATFIEPFFSDTIFGSILKYIISFIVGGLIVTMCISLFIYIPIAFTEIVRLFNMH